MVSRKGLSVLANKRSDISTKPEVRDRKEKEREKKVEIEGVQVVKECGGNTRCTPAPVMVGNRCSPSN